MSVRPRVSVCMPAYCAERWLPEVLDAIWAQDFDDFELIVVEDASPDGTYQLLAAQRDPRLRLVRHARNHGQAHALAHTLELSRGHYVKFADADDVLRPDALSRMVEALDAEPSAGLVFGRRRLRLEEPDDERSQGWAAEFGLLHTRFADLRPGLNAGPPLLDEHVSSGSASNWLAEPTGVMVRRQRLEQTGGPHLRMVQSLDMDMWLRVIAGANVVFIDDYLYDYRVALDGVTATFERGGRQWLDHLWSLEGLASIPELRRRHPAVDDQLRLRRRRAVRRLAEAAAGGSPHTSRMARELSAYARASAARRAGRPVRLHSFVPPSTE